MKSRLFIIWLLSTVIFASPLMSSKRCLWDNNLVFHKMFRNIELLRNAGCKKRKAVLFAAGSYNPVQKMHINMFKVAGSFLEDKGYAVVGGFISPRGGSYVRTKYGKAAKTNYINIIERMRLINIAIGEADLGRHLNLFPWEKESDGCFEFSKIAVAFARQIARIDKSILVFYLSGSDYFQGYEPSWVSDVSNLNICYLERVDEEFPNTARDTKNMKLIRIRDMQRMKMRKRDLNVSSTKVRKYLSSVSEEQYEDGLGSYMFPEAITYLHEKVKYRPKIEEKWNDES